MHGSHNKKEIEQKLADFLALEADALKKTTKKKIVHLTKLAMSGLYPILYSPVIENFYLNLAEKTKILSDDFKKIEFKKNSILHVMTEASQSGGHTRIVERWLKSANRNEKNSVVILGQRSCCKIPEYLKNQASTIGQFYQYDVNQSVETRANKLRELAATYETIVLHHHPEDPIPLMAFGVKEFKRPVVCFNHSGHTFWIGCKAIDFCIDIEQNQNWRTVYKRGLTNTKVLDMPVDKFYPEPTNRKKSKESLGFLDHHKILVSAASSYKYQITENLNFIKMIDEVLSKSDEIIFIGVGISQFDQNWHQLQQKYSKRVILPGMIPFSELENYFAIADLYLDSFPYNSWLSTIDAVNIGHCFCLTLATSMGTLPFLHGTDAVQNSVQNFTEAILFYLDNKNKRQKAAKHLNFLLKEKCSLEIFQKSVSNIISNTHKKLEIKSDEPSERTTITDFDIYNYSFRKAKIKKKSFFKIIEIIKDLSAYDRNMELKFFGCSIAKVTRTHRWKFLFSLFSIPFLKLGDRYKNV